MKYKSNTYFIIVLTSLLLLACEREDKETDDYQILASLLNSSFGKETDEENRKFCIDVEEGFHSLLFITNTTLEKKAFEALRNYLEKEQLTEFYLDDFDDTELWDLKKITNYRRYKLKEFNSQSLKSPYIGKLQVSNIVYNPAYDKAIVYLSFLCSDVDKCGFSAIYQLKKEEKWIFEKETILAVF